MTSHRDAETGDTVSASPSQTTTCVPPRDTNLGASQGTVGINDWVIVRGDYAPVRRVIIHPPGHGSPTVVADMYAIEVSTERGTRWLGGRDVFIGSDLRVHWSRR